jgi:hypothetical protein
MKDFFKKIRRRFFREWKDKKNLLFRINTSINRYLIAKSSDTRPTSYPFISGDTFRSKAHHIFDEISQIYPEKVKPNDIVFVDIRKINEFFKLIHPRIKSRYKLITHNGDEAVTKDLVHLMDDKVVHWFGQNINVVHQKVSAIPIGLENMSYYNNGIISNIEKIQKTHVLKKNKILYGFSIATNPIKRKPIHEVLLNIEVCEKVEGWPNALNYLNLLNTYKFVASPPGNGIDCIRTWEAMYLGVIPIVEESILTNYFKDIGLPLLVIKDWSDLYKISELSLQHIYQKISPKFSNNALYFDYWISKIEKNY